LLVSWCADGRCDMTCIDENRGRSRRPGAEDRGWSHRLGTRWSGDQEVLWRRVRSAPYTWRRAVRVSWLSHKTKVAGLSAVWPQNYWDGFLRFGFITGGGFFRFGLKTGSDGFFWFDFKTGGLGFSVWASKPVPTV
jgi:hypothetical protein